MDSNPQPNHKLDKEDAEPATPRGSTLLERPASLRLENIARTLQGQSLNQLSSLLTLQETLTVKELAELSGMNRLVSEALAESNRRLAEALSSRVPNALLDLAPIMASDWLRQFRLDAAVTQKVYSIFDAAVSRPLKAMLQTVQGSLRETFAGISRAAVRVLEAQLRHYGWWPVPGLPESFYLGIHELIEQGRSRAISRYICDWFAWNPHYRLRRMTERWDSNPHFRRRRRIYRQALQAHVRGWYYLSISALLPLLEGASQEFLQANSVHQKGDLQAIKRALGRNIPDDVYHEEMEQALIRYLTSVTFRGSRRVKRVGLELNRHGVLHGEYCDYGREDNSIRAFLLLESLYQFMSSDPGAVWLPDETEPKE